MASCKTPLLGVVAALATTLVTLASASAQVISNRWIGGNGNWSTSANWSNGTLPTSYALPTDPNSLAVIDNGSTVDLDGDVVEATQIHVLSSTLRLTDVLLNLRGAPAYYDSGGVRRETGRLAGLRVGSVNGGAAGELLLSGATIWSYGKDYLNHPTWVANEVDAGTTGTLRAAFSIGVGGADGRSDGRVVLDNNSSVSLQLTSVGGLGSIGQLEVRGGSIFYGTLRIGDIQSIYEADTLGQGHVLITGPTTTAFLESISMASGNDEGYLTIEQGAKVTVKGGLSGGRFKSDLNSAGGVGGTGIVRVTGDGTELNFTQYLVNGVTPIQGSAVLGVTGELTLILSDGAKLTTLGAAVILGQEKGRIYYGDPYSYDSKGILQIGEGGRAGLFLAPEVTTGYGTGEVVFNHNETDYTFAARITERATPLPPRSFNEPLYKDPGRTSLFVRAGGSTTLTGSSTYSGGTYIENGTLVAGSERALGWGSVTVHQGSRLTIATDLTRLRLGHVETLTYPITTEFPNPETIDITFSADLLFEGGSTLELTVASLETASPLIEIQGTLTIDAALSDPWYLLLNLPTDFNLSQAFDWTFLTTTDGITGFEEDFVLPNLGGWSVVQDGNNLNLVYAVPEPGRALLLFISIGALLMRRRRPRTFCIA